MVSSAVCPASLLGPNLQKIAHGTRWIRSSVACACFSKDILSVGAELRIQFSLVLPGMGSRRKGIVSGRRHSRAGRQWRNLEVVASPRASRGGGGIGFDGEDGAGEFEPDMESLKSGFSKKFPGKAPQGFSYDWHLDAQDDDNDGVRAQSFTGGDRGRAPSAGYPGSGRQHVKRGSEPRVAGRAAKSRESQRAFEPSKLEKHRKLESLKQDRAGEPRVVRRERPRQGSETYRLQSNSRGSRTLTKQRNGDANAVKKNKELGRGHEYDIGDGARGVQNFEDEKKKKKPVIDPVSFVTPMTKNPHVAILGGGMSGLVCALTLERHGIQATVFDTGKHGLGGRMGTRLVEETPDNQKMVFDHGAQYFTVTNPRFQLLVDSWITEGAVKEWRGKIGKLQAGGRYSELPSATRYIGTHGMRSLADSILAQSKSIVVKAPCWISNMIAADEQWKLSEGRTPQGQYDVVVIAHNGKCANRLLSTAHVPLVAKQMKRLELSSVWSLIAAFDEKLALPGGELLDGAFVEGIDSLSWMGNNTGKLVPASDDGLQCWTFLSSAAYGKKNKVPQESIPAAKSRKVREDILSGVGSALGLKDDSLPVPIFERLQLWGAALPTNTPSVPCIFEAQSRVGICGDWLLGSSLEAAALSGMALADHIANYRDHGEESPEEYNAGLHQPLGTLQGGHDIGQFPGSAESSRQPSQMEFAAVS